MKYEQASLHLCVPTVSFSLFAKLLILYVCYASTINSLINFGFVASL